MFNLNSKTINITEKSFDNFSYIWEKIAKKFIFEKKSTVEETTFKNFIIYKNDGYIVTCNDNVNNEFSQHMFAIKSNEDDNRFFVGYRFETGNYYNLSVAGMFVYFCDSGNMKSKKILNKIVCNYDPRNGNITTRCYLYKKSLIFLESHRDSKCLMITINLFDYFDNLECSGNQYCYDTVCNNFFNFVENNGRFLIVETLSDRFVLDLGNIKKKEKEIEYKTYTSYLNDVTNFINEYELVSEYEYSDGYPLNCVKCDNILAELNCSIDNTFYNMNGVCIDCKIRYSLSSKTWCCFKNSQKEHYINFCSKELNKKFDCCEEVHIETIPKIEIKRSENRPYRYTGYYTIKTKN